MKRSSLFSSTISAIFAACTFTSSNPCIEATEPSEKIVEGLQRRGYYDTALDYLKAAPNNPLVNDTFKQGIAYEQAATLIHWALNTKDARIQKQRLDQGQAKLELFLKTRPRHKRVLAVQMQIGHIELHNARSLKKQADDALPDKRDVLLKDAQEHYLQAHTRYAAVEKKSREFRNKYPPISKDKSIRRIRGELRIQILTAGLASAETLRELGLSFKDGSSQKKNFLNKAADAYYKLYRR